MQDVRLQFSKTSEDYRVKEAFKTLRTNIEFSGEDVRVIAVTSCTPNEGKSSVAMEMAKAFAEAGNRTILIDADMRKSVLVGRYKTGAVRTGLVHCLVGRAKLEDVICKTNVKNFYIAFAGPVPPNPSELLGGPRFEAMIDTLKKVYKYIIIDTPPLGSVIDAAVVSKNCDGTVLVIENNAISNKFAQKVKEQLDKGGANILGVVLNKVDMSAKGYYGHYGRYYGKYYGKYYGRYGEENESKIPAEVTQVTKAAPRATSNPVVKPTTRHATKPVAKHADAEMAIIDIDDLELDNIIPTKPKENLDLYNPVVPIGMTGMINLKDELKEAAAPIIEENASTNADAFGTIAKAATAFGEETESVMDSKNADVETGVYASQVPDDLAEAVDNIDIYN